MDIRTMAHCPTVLNQITSFISRHDFEYPANIHHTGQKFFSYNRWIQFMAMLIDQLSGRKSLRDITDNLKAQGKRLYHHGMKPRSRLSLCDQRTPPAGQGDHKNLQRALIDRAVLQVNQAGLKIKSFLGVLPVMLFSPRPGLPCVFSSLSHFLNPGQNWVLR